MSRAHAFNEHDQCKRCWLYRWELELLSGDREACEGDPR